MLVLPSFIKKRILRREMGSNLKKGCLDETIKNQKEKFSLLASKKIDKEAIPSRFYQSNLMVTTVRPVSPMAVVEPQLVELILRTSRIYHFLPATQCLLLANDLIKCTKYGHKVMPFEERRYKRKFDKVDVGKNY